MAEFSDTLYSVNQCNDQGARIIYTPFFLFESKSLMDNAETGPDLGEQVKKMTKTPTQTILWFYNSMLSHKYFPYPMPGT